MMRTTQASFQVSIGMLNGSSHLDIIRFKSNTRLRSIYICVYIAEAVWAEQGAEDHP